MSTPKTPTNPELVGQLFNLPTMDQGQRVKLVEEHLPNLGENIKNNTIAYQGAAQRKSRAAIAALLCDNGSLRSFAVAKGFNVGRFDDEIGRLRDEWHSATTKPPNGRQFVNVLRKMVGL